jgi:hypothetical protein
LLARRLPRNGKSPPARLGRLHQIGRGGTHLAAEREPLHHSRDDGDYRGSDADGLVGRRDGQRDDREAHQDEAEDHCGPASHAVGIGPDHNAADRPGNEPRSERGKRQHQTGILAVRGEKRVADLDREKAVGDEIIEFEHIADGRAEDRATAERR